MAPVDRRTHNTVKTIYVNLKNQFSGPTSGMVVDVVPGFRTMTVWIPLKGKYLYENDSNNVGKKHNLIIHACAFSAHPQISQSILF
jgi:hypothetical protein